jgi:hypothetical protein
MKNASWIILTLAGGLTLLGGLVSLGIAYGSVQDQIGPATLAELSVGRPDVAIAVRARRATAAAYGAGFATLFVAITLGPYRRGDVWAWWALFAGILVVSGSILLRVHRIRVSAKLDPALLDSIETSGTLDILNAIRVYEDVVELAVNGKSEPITGRIVSPACLPIGGVCRALSNIARIHRSEAGGDVTVWLNSTDGSVIFRRSTTLAFPTGTIKLQTDPDTIQEINLATVRDILFAVKRISPPARASK